MCYFLSSQHNTILKAVAGSFEFYFDELDVGPTAGVLRSRYLPVKTVGDWNAVQE